MNSIEINAKYGQMMILMFSNFITQFNTKLFSIKINLGA